MQQITIKIHFLLQFFLLIINLKKTITLPTELPFVLPSLTKIDIQKVEKQKNEYKIEEKHSFSKFIIFLYKFYIVIIIFIVINCFE